MHRLLGLLLASSLVISPFACSSSGSSAGAPAPVCASACTPGVSKCTSGGVATCVASNGCGTWSAPVACATGQTCADGACTSTASPPDASTTSCSGVPGDFHQQDLVSGDETRHYFLHVPRDYTCDKKWPLVVDFHGTGFGALTDPVEESWAFDEMIEASDTEHFIVVRPRSRPTASGSAYVYQWDLNPGDLAKNHAFALALVADLESRYNIDDKRVYAMGFSNGPTMAAQFLADSPSIMHGYAAISGGMNEAIAPGPSLAGAGAPRVYEMTGYRDYMLGTQRTLDAYLSAQGLDAARVFRREADTGHELYGWHYHEAFRWMDAGVRPAPGTLSTAWTRDATFAGKESLVQLAKDHTGTLHAVGTGGAIYRRDAASWTRTASLSSGNLALPLVDVCFLSSGEGFAAGDGWLATTADGASWSVAPRVPEYGTKQFGYTHVTSVGCSDTHLVAAGVWSAAARTEPGGAWGAVTLGTNPPFFTQVRRLPSGTWLGTGYYDAIARSTDGVTFATVDPPAEVEWLNALTVDTAGNVWIVGEKGTIFASSNDGVTFRAVSAPGKEDLYAIAFSSDGARALAVGSHGAAYATTDGGATWVDRSTGLDGFLGDVAFVDDHTAIAVGEAGTVLTTKL